VASRRIDLNADLGEGFGSWALTDDDALLRRATSANVACGFPAGDATHMRHVCEVAAERGVTVGAQVSYRDLAGFGRRFIDVAPDELTNDVVYQVGALDAIARACGTRVSYVKPHGALYNAIVHHEGQARAVVDALTLLDGRLPLLGLPGGLVLDLAREAGLPVVAEAFADRAYAPDGTLVPRSEPNAVLDDPAAIAARVVRLALEGVIEAVDGSTVEVAADSVCVHGDSPGAVASARAVRDALTSAGVTVAPFAGG
jgi:UPF0271 protein